MIRRGVIENVEDLEGLTIGDAVGLYDKDGKIPAVQVALKTDGNQWALAGQSVTWSTQSLFHTAQDERLHIHLMRRA